MRNARLNINKRGDSSDTADLLERYLDLVRTWSRTASLVSKGDLGVLRSRHLDDSLALVENLTDAKSLLDIGSGGGFPGLPLGIVLPELAVTLAERNAKKCAFLSHVVMTLQLPNIQVTRASIPSDSSRLGQFDAVTARAVAAPREVWRWSQKLLSASGKLYLQSTDALSETMFAGAKLSNWQSSGIGWINCIERSSDTA